jgi:hypothetical protein
MVPYAIQQNDITPDHQETYYQVLVALSQVPDDWDCHQVCEMIATLIPGLIHERGYFVSKGMSHSWLRFPDQPVIFDVYPWATNVPFLVYVGGMSPWKKLYVPVNPSQPIEEKLSDLFDPNS